MVSAVFCCAVALQLSPESTTATRRSAVKHIFGGAASAIFLPTHLPAFAEDPAANSMATFKYEDRDRKSNKEALIREDYWYFSGKKPPRRLNIDAFPADDPTWNAWG